MAQFVRLTPCAVAFLGAVCSWSTAEAQSVPTRSFEIAQASKQQAPAAKGAPASQPAPAQAAPAVPPPEVMLILVRNAVIALDQANKTNNYSVFHGLGGPMLQQSSPEKLAQSFASLRDAKVDMQATAVLNPQLIEPATVTKDGILNMVGLFPSQPLQLRFQIAYQSVAGSWRLGGMNVAVVPASTAAAPAAKQPAPAAPAKK